MTTFATNFIRCSAENVKALSWGCGGGGGGGGGVGVELRHTIFDCPPHVV